MSMTGRYTCVAFNLPSFEVHNCEIRMLCFRRNDQNSHAGGSVLSVFGTGALVFNALLGPGIVMLPQLFQESVSACTPALAWRHRRSRRHRRMCSSQASCICAPSEEFPFACFILHNRSAALSDRNLARWHFFQDLLCSVCIIFLSPQYLTVALHDHTFSRGE